MNNDFLKISYTYVFRNGVAKTFDVLLDRKTLGLMMKPTPQPPSWTFLKQNQCANCSLDARDHPFCPVALNFAGIAEHFAHAMSYEEVHVVVTTEERVYSRDTALQQGLTSLLGIIMPTSGCPILEPLKPMVRFHLPFATITETVFRMVSMCLVAQYLRHGEGKPFDFGLRELAKVYAEAAIVNRTSFDACAMPQWKTRTSTRWWALTVSPPWFPSSPRIRSMKSGSISRLFSNNDGKRCAS